MSDLDELVHLQGEVVRLSRERDIAQGSLRSVIAAAMKEIAGRAKDCRARMKGLPQHMASPLCDKAGAYDHAGKILSGLLERHDPEALTLLELLAVSERFRAAWHEHHGRLCALLGDVDDTPLAHEILTGQPMGHGTLDRAARRALGPLWDGWRSRAETAYAALARIDGACGVEPTLPELDAERVCAVVTSLREQAAELARTSENMRQGLRRMQALPRAGQAAFNALADVDPAFADSIRGGMADPFHADGRICEMLAAWRLHLLGPETMARLERMELDAVNRGDVAFAYHAERVECPSCTQVFHVTCAECGQCLEKCCSGAHPKKRNDV